jgi:hypothetical protein
MRIDRYPGAAADPCLTGRDGLDISLHIDAGHLPVEVREQLVDAIFAIPELQHVHQIRATIPLGDSALLTARRWPPAPLDHPGHARLRLPRRRHRDRT